MKEIAEMANVSVMTVSRALRNSPGISGETRERVLEIANEVGYQKNPLVSALMTQRRKGAPADISLTVAHIHCLPADRKLTGNLLTLRQGIRSQAKKHGFEVSEFYLNEPGMTPQRLANILSSRGIRAAIFEHFFEDGVELDIDLSSISAVALTHTMRKPNLNRVVVAEYLSVLVATEHLEKLGYQKIGLIVNPRQEAIARIKREAAWLLHQQNLPEHARVPLLVSEREGFESALESWLKTHTPDAIICPYRRAKPLIDQLDQKIGYVQLGWHEDDTELAGVDPNWRQVGISAVNKVVDQLFRGEFGEPQTPTVTSIDCHWQDGPSVQVPN
ncbi:LacI family DNA-binding transcriptional regulator [Pelagicoccus mobilis]